MRCLKDLEAAYLGRQIMVDLDDVDDYEMDWTCNFSEVGEELLGGEGHVCLDYRGYAPEASGEEADWSIETGLDFSVDDAGLLESIDLTARISCPGDSGLGDSDPEDEWTQKDYALAGEFLAFITHGAQ